VVRIVKPKVVLRNRLRSAPTQIQIAPAPDLPIQRGLAGPGLLADTIVRRWQDHLPLHRLEQIYAREGLELARSTLCGWHAELAAHAQILVDAMWEDARESPVLCTDATGVLVQAKERCRSGHFWVVVAPERHVLFAYSAQHNSAAVDVMLAGYQGYLVADALRVRPPVRGRHGGRGGLLGSLQALLFQGAVQRAGAIARGAGADRPALPDRARPG
jgi:transposase